MERLLVLSHVCGQRSQTARRNAGDAGHRRLDSRQTCDTEATLDALENRTESLEADADYRTEKRRARLVASRRIYRTTRRSTIHREHVNQRVRASMFFINHVDERTETGGGARTVRQQPMTLALARPRWSQTAAVLDSPVTMERFARETGYYLLALGKLGSGKSFGTKL